MGGRYFITGVQLGMLIALREGDRTKLVDDIIDKQYLGTMVNTPFGLQNTTTDNATDRQLKFLSDLGVEGDNFTKEEAKNLIKSTLEQRNSQQTKTKSLEDESISRRGHESDETFEKDKTADNTHQTEQTIQKESEDVLNKELDSDNSVEAKTDEFPDY